MLLLSFGYTYFTDSFCYLASSSVACNGHILWETSPCALDALGCLSLGACVSVLRCGAMFVFSCHACSPTAFCHRVAHLMLLDRERVCNSPVNCTLVHFYVARMPVSLHVILCICLWWRKVTALDAPTQFHSSELTKMQSGAVRMDCHSRSCA